MTEREAFGAELRRARERRGLTLDAIAEQTKVSASHFSGLERGDLSRWPSGIFRRAFVRSYALAVGLDPEESVAEFGRLFPDPAEGRAPDGPAAVQLPGPDRRGVQETPQPGSRLLLEQAVSRHAGFVPLARRVVAGLLDISIALMSRGPGRPGGGLHWFWPVAAAVAMTGHLACYAAWARRRARGSWHASPTPPAAVTEVRVERRRAEAEKSMPPRRHVSRHAASRPAPHVHRVRH